jgi:hypothetical protein
MRVSITSGSRRDTTTSGFFFGISLVRLRVYVVLQQRFCDCDYDIHRLPAADEKAPASFPGFNRVLTAVSDKTNTRPFSGRIRLPSR